MEIFHTEQQVFQMGKWRCLTHELHVADQGIHSCRKNWDEEEQDEE